MIDAGAVLVPGDSCQPIDSHTVRCVPRPDPGQVLSARVVLGDMHDGLTVEGVGERFVGADGGPGNDRLVGGSGQDELRGGGGMDDLSSGDGDDRLIDGDADGAVGNAGPGPDRFDGGAGTDTVSYAQRTAPVSADLAAGEGADGDRLANVESLIGGRGDDRLAGDDLPNVLDGHRGQDRLTGRGGRDELLRAGGPVSCGGGSDTYIGGRSSRDVLQPDCEVLSPESDARISANPVAARRRVVWFWVRCPVTIDVDYGDEVLGSCGPGPLRLREAGGSRRTLALGHLPADRWQGRLVGARLTPLGRRLATRRHGVAARVLLTGYYREGPPLRWTIRLKVPR